MAHKELIHTKQLTTISTYQHGLIFRLLKTLSTPYQRSYSEKCSCKYYVLIRQYHFATKETVHCATCDPEF